ncbi:polyprenyl synthetase family protein [Solwaraspora sp. WMMA2056]|uniref:polyprenyl synthetase family protein n=1 Tax=Solwaraspora sp. WMMA2056 TaxID=3015161 RepID=UPI00259B1607|nr:polyprenyl synthetase family protein [Solwaraspora sp. WMMA2056]WJK41340.1 polyprenyl synthetase family protein [Solwaraspora sp. WMMA2056]
MAAAVLDGCFKILLLKSAKYTVERPLQIGAALAGASAAEMEVLSRYGIAVGEAFQLRNDVLGVFGDDAVTGKSALTDLRDGKATVLMALVRQSASAAQAQVIEDLHGNPDLDDAGAKRLREIIMDTGGLRRVEEMIDRRTEQAVAALREMSAADGCREVLGQMACELSRRTH